VHELDKYDYMDYELCKNVNGKETTYSEMYVHAHSCYQDQQFLNTFHISATVKSKIS